MSVEQSSKTNDGKTLNVTSKKFVAMERIHTVLPKVDLDGQSLNLLRQDEQRYVAVKQLGEGAAGVVNLVQDKDISRAVAMKTTKDQNSDIALARFVEEVRTVGQLDHPNIIPIHDVGVSDNGEYFFTMKYIEGESLREIITKLQRGDKEYHAIYTFERRMAIFLEVLHAVNFAHDRGFIHRDIKPDNIMVGAYGEVVLMDWGIAKKIKDAHSSKLDKFLVSESSPSDRAQPQRVFETEHGTLIGTPGYMAPEQVTGKIDALDERTDIYSLSVMLYEFLTLNHYLRTLKPDLTSQLLGVLKHEPISPDKLSISIQGKVPREYYFIMKRGYQKSPEKRFQSVQEMIVQVQRNLEGRIVISCPSTFLKHFVFKYGRYLDSHRIFGVAFFVFILALLVMGVIQGVRWLSLLFS